MIRWFLSLLLLTCCITFIDLPMFNHVWIPGIKRLGHNEWSFSCVFVFSLSLIYGGFLHRCSLRRLADSSLFLEVSLSGVWMGVLLTSLNEVGNDACLSISWNNLRWVHISSCLMVWENSAENPTGPGILFWGETLYCCFNFTLCCRSIQVINILLVQFWMVISI
jgi:hypothetical protein